jgi:hypothetical protein
VHQVSGFFAFPSHSAEPAEDSVRSCEVTNKCIRPPSPRHLLSAERRESLALRTEAGAQHASARSTIHTEFWEALHRLALAVERTHGFTRMSCPHPSCAAHA